MINLMSHPFDKDSVVMRTFNSINCTARHGMFRCSARKLWNERIRIRVALSSINLITRVHVKSYFPLRVFLLALDSGIFPKF